MNYISHYVSDAIGPVPAPSRGENGLERAGSDHRAGRLASLVSAVRGLWSPAHHDHSASERHS